MNASVETLLVAQRELRTNFRSAKGVALLVLTLLGGALVAVIISKGLAAAKPQLGLDGTTVTDVTPALIAMLGLSTILRITVWLTPLIVLIIGFDGISSELQYRSVRYWTVRVRRASYYVGKVLGLWAVVAIVTLGMDLLVWGVFLANGQSASDVMKSGPVLWLVSLPISLAWSAIASIVGSQFRAPMLSLLITWACFFGLFIVAIVGAATKVVALQVVYPNFYEDLMLADEPKKVALGAAGCLALGAIVTAAGAFGFTRRDL
jgi:ABC-type transport system involved in multi-copper enzyme maturation permease subunit